jgi:TDG/mug DNA glycosylase family protein
MIETHPFGHFVPKNIRYLLLGSFTSNQFMKDSNYDWFYGSKRNQFWPIIRDVYSLKLESKIDKVNLFEKLGIGIADIIYQCERRDGNSLDTNLINIIYNPELENILKMNKLNAILFSSRYVEKLYKKTFKNLVSEFPQIELITLPSPSPRYAAMSRDEKIAKYKEILPKLI